MEPRPRSFYILAAFFTLYVIFLYGPTITITILSFQGPGGGLTFPMRGTSLHWFDELFQQQAVGDIWGSFRRSFSLGIMVMVTTTVVSVMGGLAFRKRFYGSGILFYLVITALVIPSILVSLGVGLVFTQGHLPIHWATSGFGAQLTWTLPFGLLIMFAVFNRFNPAFEEAARDQGASPWQTIRHVVLPNSISGILTGVILQVSRAAGETAPILFTGAAFYLPYLPTSVRDQCMALSMHLFTISTQVPNVPPALPYATAVVLVGVILMVNTTAILIRTRLRGKRIW